MNRMSDRSGPPPETPSDRMITTFLGQDDDPDVRKAKQWTGLDVTNVGIAHLGTTLFRLNFLTHLYISRNELEYLPHQIALLENLEVLDASANRIQVLPAELGSMKKLKELLLYSNLLTTLPFELGRLHQLRVLGLHGNPLSEPLLSYADSTDALVNYLMENSPVTRAPPERMWIYPTNIDVANYKLNGKTVTAFCYNVLCDKYATRSIFKYCPQWALDWEHRRGSILKEILTHMSDIVCLQEVESSQYYSFFLPELQSRGYGGLFRPKSRARTMNHDNVDGCAIFFHTSKYRQKEEHLIEFDQLSTRYSSGCAAMLNRVMPKDNIALCALLENVKTNDMLFVCNLHLTWDPAYKDVKVIQMALTLKEMESFLRDRKCANVPMLVMGDFNSLHDSGVYELIDSGRLARDHDDFVGYDYAKFFETVGLRHGLRLKSAYTTEMPYSNYTAQFKGIIDYIWYSQDHMIPTALLGPVDEDYMRQYVDGCPNAHFPSDHLALSAEFSFLDK